MKLKNDQSGFSAFEGILIVVIVALIALVGMLVYNGRTKAVVVTKSAATTKTSTAAGTAEKSDASPQTGPAKNELYLIPEWKVSASIPTPPADAALIQYVINSSNGQAYASFTTQEIVNADKTCTADYAPAGVIMRALPTDHFYLEDGSDSGQTVAQALQQRDTIVHTQVGTYDYWYIHPQSLCGTAANGPQLQTDAINQVKAILTNLKDGTE